MDSVMKGLMGTMPLRIFGLEPPVYDPVIMKVWVVSGTWAVNAGERLAAGSRRSSRKADIRILLLKNGTLERQQHITYHHHVLLGHETWSVSSARQFSHVSG